MDRREEGDVNLAELVIVIWQERRLIFISTGIFFIISIFVALTSKKEYEASCRLMPESQEGIGVSLGGLGGLAGLAGIDLGLGSAGSLTPDLYPEIVNSTPFQLTLLHSPLKFEELNSEYSSYTYFTEIEKKSPLEWLGEYTIGLPGKLKELLIAEEVPIHDQSENLIRLSKDDWEILEEYKSRFSVAVSSKTGIITIGTQMPDPYAAAQIADILVRELTREVTEYKIEKAKVNLEFIAERYAEAEKEYQQRQKKVARFADQNKNINSSLVQIEYQRLQNEMNIAFEVYKGLATQLEQAKIKIEEETPVFTVLEPVQIPVEKSKPRRSLIVVFGSFLGGMLAAGFVYLKSSTNWNLNRNPNQVNNK